MVIILRIKKVGIKIFETEKVFYFAEANAIHTRALSPLLSSLSFFFSRI